MSTMNLTLKIWRQKDAKSKGQMVEYKVNNISDHMSFLEMLDILNEQLIEKGEEPVAFDHDCREGICGMCSLFINGEAHGPDRGITTCQLHMRMFKDGDTITIEPWRATAFPVIKDLMVDRSAFERISKLEVISLSILPGILRMPMLFLFLSVMLTALWTLPLV